MALTKEELQKRCDNVSKSRTFTNILNEYGLRNKRVLDIGCSNGEYLAHFGPGSVGLTVNEDEVASGKLLSLDIRIGNIEEMEDGELPEKFDAIFANNIFEHMLAPHLFLLKLKKYLKDDGFVIIGVPAVPYFFPLIYIQRFSYALSRAHVNFFTRYTLHKTVEYGGYDVIKNSGFYFTNKFLDLLFNFVCPHFYAVAKVKKDFAYDAKRMTELSGYKKTKIINN